MEGGEIKLLNPESSENFLLNYFVSLPIQPNSNEKVICSYWPARFNNNSFTFHFFFTMGNVVGA